MVMDNQFDTVRERGSISNFSVVEPDGCYAVPRPNGEIGYSRAAKWWSNSIWNPEPNSKTISKGLTTW